MELYFKTKFFLTYIVPGSILLFFLLVLIKEGIVQSLRMSLMKKLGYRLDGYCGKMSYEHQQHWRKGEIKIHHKELDSVGYFKLKKYVESMENKKHAQEAKK